MRVQHSGAYTGGINASRKSTMTEGQIRHMKGDIVPPDNWKHFNCEAKNYAAFPFHRLLFNEPIPLLENWLEQLKIASDQDDINILYLKVTRIGKFVCFESEQPFLTGRHVEYTDRFSNKWAVTELNSFFELNRAIFEQLHS